MDGLTKVLNIALATDTRQGLRSDEGILTATDDRMFVGFQLLYSSLVMRHDCKMAVIDLGMKTSQRYWCLQQKNILLITPMLDCLKFVGKDGWIKWNKPYFLLASPFVKTLWLDSDTMILNDLSQVFFLLEEEPLIVNGHHYIPSKDWLFSKMKEFVPIPNYSHYPNTGVIGLNLYRDYWLIRDWMYVVEHISRSYVLDYLGRDLEVSAFAWALAKNCKLDLPMENPAWNWLAQSGVSDDKYINYDSPEELLVSVKHDFPIAHILHWHGYPKPWLLWKEDLLDLNPHYR